jgi:F-type H+-transporting ATPase subunit a
MGTDEIVFYLFGWPVTSYITTMWGIMVVLALLGLFASHNMKKTPGRFQMLGEYAVGGLLNFFGTIIGPERARRYFPLLGTLFLFILFSNWSGLIPGAGHVYGFHPPTSTISVTAALAIIVFFAVHSIGVREKGWRYFEHFLKPFWFLLPLNIIDELVKPLSLSVRLYGNIYGEEMVAAVLLSLFAPLTPVPMQLLGILFGFIQALVFTTLTACYINLATVAYH